MAKGENADFSLTIGLNLDDLFQGMDEANTTISQAISRINSENKQVKLKADISELKAGSDEAKRQAIQMQALTRQIELQTAKLRLLGQARQSAYRDTGENSRLSRAADTRYLQQAKYLAQLQAQLTKLQATANKGGVFGKLNEEASKAKAGITSLSGAYSKFTGMFAAGMGIAMTGAGLFNITNSAMQAGESIYKLSTRLHLSTAEASKLNTVFKLAGTDIQSIIPYFSQLDKSVMSSANGLNTQTIALMKYGIQLKDAQGNLLPLNEQLDQLAKGYQKAANSGNLEEFQAEVLGRRGASLVPLLDNYSAYMEAANSVANTGMLDPKEAHELNIEYYKMQIQASKLSNAFGSAMIPIAKEIMPEVTASVKELVEYIKSNKDEITDDIKAFGSALKWVGENAASVAKSVHTMVSSMEQSDTGKNMRANANMFNYEQNVIDANGLGGLRTYGKVTFGLLGAYLGRIGGVKGAALGGAAGAWLGNGVMTNITRGAAGLQGTWEGMKDRYNDKRYLNGENVEIGAMGDLASKALNGGKLDTSAWDKYKLSTDNVKKSLTDLNHVSSMFDQKQKDTSQSLGKNTEAQNANSQAAKENANAQKQAAEAMKWRATVAGQLSEKIYALTHNDVENAQHAMWTEVEKAQASGVPQDLINKYIGAQSAKINADKFRNVTAPMAEAFQNDFQKQLSQIDLQKKAFEKAGATVEEAEAWAAQRTQQAYQDREDNVLGPMGQAFKTDLQNQLDDIDRQKRNYIKQGASDEYADAWAQKRKEQVNAEWDNQVASQIDSIWQSSIQKRLSEIDREKKAWVQKGLDEVKATKWAEESKRQAMQETAQNMFTSQKKYYDVWKKAGGMNSGQAGVNAIMDEMRKEKGIPKDAFTTPGEIKAFEAAMKAANDNLIPIISDGTYKGVKAAMVEVLSGNKPTNVLPVEDMQRFQTSMANAGTSFSTPVENAGTKVAGDISNASAGMANVVNQSAEVIHGATASFANGVVESGKCFKIAVEDGVQVIRGIASESIGRGLEGKDGMAYRSPTEAEMSSIMQNAAKENYGEDASVWGRRGESPWLITSSGYQVNPIYNPYSSQYDPTAMEGLKQAAAIAPAVSDAMNKMLETVNRMQGAIPKRANYDRQVNDYSQDRQPRNINLNVNVTGIEDADRKIADAAADIIVKALPEAQSGLSY